MIQRYFIADLHLTENEPEITTGFFRFLSNLPNHCELYILGDFFDYWVGDDAMDQTQTEITQQLLSLKEKQIAVFFICGNRDFLVGKKFAKQANVNLLPDIYFISETKTLLLHGDLLCTQDLNYQRFRAKIHQKWRQELFLRFPKWIRLWIAKKIRQKSKQSNQYKASELMDAVPKTVLAYFNQYQAQTMIHGHTHQPQKEVIQSIHAERFVLGAWHDGLNYLYQDENGIYHYVCFNSSI